METGNLRVIVEDDIAALSPADSNHQFFLIRQYVPMECPSIVGAIHIREHDTSLDRLHSLWRGVGNMFAMFFLAAHSSFPLSFASNFLRASVRIWRDGS